MKKLTAVEWLFQEMNRIRLEVECENIGAVQFFYLQNDAIEKAKAMEKEQVEQAYSDGLGNGMHFERGDASASVLDENNYYNETYGQNPQAKERAANYMKLKGALDEHKRK